VTTPDEPGAPGYRTHWGAATDRIFQCRESPPDGTLTGNHLYIELMSTCGGGVAGAGAVSGIVIETALAPKGRHGEVLQSGGVRYRRPVVAAADPS
jgi:hypothetical protein